MNKLKLHPTELLLFFMSLFRFLVHVKTGKKYFIWNWKTIERVRENEIFVTRWIMVCRVGKLSFVNLLWESHITTCFVINERIGDQISSSTFLSAARFKLCFPPFTTASPFWRNDTWAENRCLRRRIRSIIFSEKGPQFLFLLFKGKWRWNWIFLGQIFLWFKRLFFLL